MKITANRKKSDVARLVWTTFRDAHRRTQLIIVVALVWFPWILTLDVLEARNLAVSGAKHLATWDHQGRHGWLLTLVQPNSEAESAMNAPAIKSFITRAAPALFADPALSLPDRQVRYKYCALLMALLVVGAWFWGLWLFNFAEDIKTMLMKGRSHQLRWRSADAQHPEFAELLLFSFLLPEDAKAAAEQMEDMYNRKLSKFSSSEVAKVNRWYSRQVIVSLPKYFWMTVKKAYGLENKRQVIG